MHSNETERENEYLRMMILRSTRKFWHIFLDVCEVSTTNIYLFENSPIHVNECHKFLLKNRRFNSSMLGKV